MANSYAKVTIVGLSPLSWSRFHDEPKLEKEKPDAYDERTWIKKLHTKDVDGEERMFIPAHGLLQCIAAGATGTGEKIGTQTWGQKFRSGLLFPDDPLIDNPMSDVRCVTIFAHANGRRGPGTRVMRRFPYLPPGWTARFEVYMLDEIIVRDMFVRMVNVAGMFKWLGRFRPENSGTNGRFRIKEIDWQDNRELVFR